MKLILNVQFLKIKLKISNNVLLHAMERGYFTLIHTKIGGLRFLLLSTIIHSST